MTKRKSEIGPKSIVMIILTIILLVINKMIIRTIPFKIIGRYLGNIGIESQHYNNIAMELRAKKIGKIIDATASFLPWQSKCYEKALTAKIFLNMFKIPSTVYFGITKDQGGGLKAHAWVKSNESYIVGKYIKDQYYTVAFFG